MTGNDKFKQMIVDVAAEKGLDIILKPEAYQALLQQKKEELLKANEVLEGADQIIKTEEKQEDKEEKIEDKPVEANTSDNEPVKKKGFSM